METEFLKDTFLGMLQVMKADLDKLSEIPDGLTREEAINLTNAGQAFRTTPPIGQNGLYVAMLHSKLTVPLAMTCFSIMDLLGEILALNVGLQKDDSSKKSKAFIKHARAFLDFGKGLP